VTSIRKKSSSSLGRVLI